jgi:hypothetical protein
MSTPGIVGISMRGLLRSLEMLKRRAYPPAKLERLAADSPFQTCTISTEGIGLEVRLKKPVA